MLADIIAEIKNVPFDYSELPHLENLYKRLGYLGVLANRVPKGTRIMRATLNDNPNISIREVKRMSVRDVRDVTNLGRSHLKNEPIFYGAINEPLEFVTNKIKEPPGRLFSFFEISKIAKSENDGEEKVTFGLWKTIKDMNLISIFASEYFLKVEKHFVNQLIDYRSQIAALEQADPDWEIVLRYFSDEFAKVVNDENEIEYLKSASFGSYIRRLNFGNEFIDGIVYPSVKTREFEESPIGLNVALFPHAYTQKITLDSVAECIAYKGGKDFIIDNEKFCMVHPGQKKFTLEKVDRKFHHGRERALRELNILAR